jgi:hypothetical protein
MMGLLADLERSLISERTRPGSGQPNAITVSQDVSSGILLKFKECNEADDIGKPCREMTTTS